MKTNKMVAAVSAFVMASSVAALNVSATQANTYTVAYDTVTESFETESGVAVPTGAIAVTMSINRNTGFDSNTFALQLDDDYTIISNATGEVAWEKGYALNGFHAAIDENDNKICVATAASFESRLDGDLFTVYVSKNAPIASENVAEIIALEDYPPSASVNTLVVGLIGDVNNNGVVNSSDATAIYSAVENNNGQFFYSALAVTSYMHTYFPNTPSRKALNCINNPNWVTIYNQTGIDTRVVDDSDGDEILVYAVKHANGSFYSGMVGGSYDDEV